MTLPVSVCGNARIAIRPREAGEIRTLPASVCRRVEGGDAQQNEEREHLPTLLASVDKRGSRLSTLTPTLLSKLGGGRKCPSVLSC